MKTLIRLGTRPLQADLSLRWAYMPIRWFCHDGRVIFGNDAVEKIYVYVCLGTSFRFRKTLGLQNCQNDRKYYFVFRLCAMYAFYHLYVRLSFTVNDCRSDVPPVNISFPIISGEFDALHQLSVNKKRSFGNTASKAWKQQTWFYWVCSWQIMAYATSLTPPSPELSATALK